MKILMTSSGGVIKGLNTPEYGLARELVAKGHDVTVLSSSSVMRKHDALAEETIEGIKIRRMNPVIPSSLLYMLRNSFDLIHMHHLGYLAPISSYAALRRKIKKTPTLFTVHGIYHDPYIVDDVEDPLSGSIKRKIQLPFPVMPWKIPEWFVHLPFGADRITALTEWEKSEVARLGIDKRKIGVIPNGIVLGKYKMKDRNFFSERGIEGNILLFVGQPTSRKGWKYFIEAMPLILKEFPDAKAVFIGYRRNDEMEEMCGSLGIRNSVISLGFLPEEEKIKAFQSADIFVFPTLYEGFGQVFIEAMASGLPIVTTDTAGNSEIVEHGRNGILVKPKNSLEISEAVIRLLRRKAARKKISRNNLKKAGDYDWKKVAKRFLAAYESVIP
ncbi:MAG: glycosyltransferase family 4 protein [Candidatus Aenigmarchaeota archaeon]|nr:glycosyltransferase family 4 protein [Candidatus Aenigmarchaeota archaeon]